MLKFEIANVAFETNLFPKPGQGKARQDRAKPNQTKQIQIQTRFNCSMQRSHGNQEDTSLSWLSFERNWLFLA